MVLTTFEAMVVLIATVLAIGIKASWERAEVLAWELLVMVTSTTTTTIAHVIIVPPAI